MPAFVVEQLAKLQENPKNIRNICILAHVDHGKTTLADSLIASNGIISQRMAGKLRYMDSRKDEQERGITMKSSVISLHHTFGAQDYLIYLMDSPGHVDFSGEVSTAVRLCDGAVVVVDIIEGVCPQTKVALRQALLEHIKPVLVLNKIDRLILEKKLTPFDAYIHIQQILEQVNAVMGELFTTEVLEKMSKVEAAISNVNKTSEEQFSDWSSGLEETDDSTFYFVPEQGNVIFASAFDGWGFSIAQFAKIYAEKLGFREDILKRTLWGDFYMKNKRIMKGAQAKLKKPLFVQLVLDNIWNVYEAVVTKRDKEMTVKIIESLNLKVAARDLKHSDPKVQIQSICGQWLPLAVAVLDMVVRTVPSACDLSEERVESLMCSTGNSFQSLPVVTQLLKKHFLECSSKESDPLIVCVSKMFPVDVKNLPQKKIRPLSAEEIQQKREQVKQRQAERLLAPSSKENPSSSGLTGSEYYQLPVQVPVSEKTTFVAFARVFSGNLTKGNRVYVLGPKHDPRKALDQKEPVDPNITLKDLRSDQHITVATIDELYLLMGRELELLTSVGAGNILGLGGLEEHVLKSATLSSSLACPPFVDVHMPALPILRVALEPVHPNDMSSLIEGLKLLNQADPCAQVLVQETGEHVLITSGEVHLQRCLDDLKERFAKVEINVSSPIVPFRETIILPPKLDMVNEIIEGKCTTSKISKVVDEEIEHPTDGAVLIQTANQQSSIRIRAVPLPDDATQLLEKNSHLLKIQDKVLKNRNEISSLAADIVKSLSEFKSELSRIFTEAGPNWTNVLDHIWSFGPRRCGPNLLLNRVQQYHRPSVWCDEEESTVVSSVYSEYDSSFISGFQLATLQGPLCEEPMMGVCFVVERWDMKPKLELTEDVSSAGVPFGPFTGQIMSTVKEGCRRAFQAQPQRLMAAMYSCNIQVTAEVLGKMYAVLGRRHGRILGGDLREGSQTFSVEAVLPVIESFQFANEIRKQTSGMASPQLLFSHWEVVDVDPFWVPTTEEEYLHFGEKADSDNRALKYMNAVRRRKGLPVTQKIVEHAEKQRTLAKRK